LQLGNEEVVLAGTSLVLGEGIVVAVVVVVVEVEGNVDGQMQTPGETSYWPGKHPPVVVVNSSAKARTTPPPARPDIGSPIAIKAAARLAPTAPRRRRPRVTASF
jgi:hypothetical protein